MSGQRIELNAFRPQQMLDWLSESIEANGIEKVIPPDELLDKEFRYVQEEMIRSRLMAGVDRQIAKEMVGFELPDDLANSVEDAFGDEPTLSWKSAIKQIHSDWSSSQ